MTPGSALVLAGDLGGTKTTLGVFSPERGPRDPLVSTRLVSEDHAGLAEMCEAFLHDVGLPVCHAVFGVAGPVLGGRARITNLPWDLEETALAERLGLHRVTLLNDLVAMAHGVPELDDAESLPIIPGTADPAGPIGILAPGTGLGMAWGLRDDDGTLRAFPSEGGHTAFAPQGELQEGLLAFLRERYGYVSNERVCSGMGLPNLYAWLRQTDPEAEPEWLATALAQAEDPTPVIAQAAMERNVALARRTLELFVVILGSLAGDLALTVMSTGGIWIGGGIAPRILPLLTDGAFREAFLTKGRLRRFVETVPVRLIQRADTPLVGAASRALADAPMHA